MSSDAKDYDPQLKSIESELLSNILTQRKGVLWESYKETEHKLLKKLMDHKIEKMKQNIMEELYVPGGLFEKIGKIQFNKTCQNDVYSTGSLDE
jgi:hypothetical protein